MNAADVTPDPIALARLERGHIEALQALVDLRETWKQEDHVRAEARKAVWEAHEQGARDRDAMRVRLGGHSLIEADKHAAEAAAAARIKAADDAAAARKAAQDAKAAEDAATAKAADEARDKQVKADAADAKA
jgi:hypothetical protein